jgi:type VII secretion-associated serine protease mycosin
LLAGFISLAIAVTGLGVGLNGNAQPIRRPQPRPVRTVAGSAALGQTTSPRFAAPASNGKTGSPNAAESSAPARTGRNDTVPGTVVVHVTGNAEKAAQAVRDAGGTVTGTIESLSSLVVDTNGRNIRPALEDVGSVEPVGIRYASADPNDEDYPSQGHLFVTRMPIAWEVTKGSATTDIAILDTGVDLDHPDLNDRIVAGFDFVNNDTDATDDDGHGTMVAGVAAAETNNSIGVAGVAWNARIIPVKVLNADGVGTDDKIAQGIVWAVDNGAEVVNLSFAGSSPSTLLTNAVTYAISHGVVVVAAGGNEGSSAPSYPAAIPEVIAVGATDLAGNAASFTNFGPWVDIAAPGADITSTAMGADEAYGVGSGTSFASPIVAGVALLMKAKNPSWTPAQITSKLLSSAADRGPDGIDDAYGRGLIDAYGALEGRTSISPPAPRGDANEPNDIPDRAKAVAATPVQATMVPEFDTDWFSVQASQAGVIKFTVTPPAETGWLGFDPVIEGVSPDYVLKRRADETGIAEAETLNMPVPSAGTYFFRVFNKLASKETAPYSVSSTFLANTVTNPTGTKLWVRSTTPNDFGTAFATGGKPAVVFARNLNMGSVNTSTVKMFDARSGAAVPASVSYSLLNRTATITPTQALAAGRPYFVEVKGVTELLTGDTMTVPYRFRFTAARAVAAPKTKADINGDGFDDVIIGVPTEDFGKLTDVGAVHIMYGSATGVKTSGSTLITQDSPNVGDTAELGDRFGSVIATGDVNNDSYDDVAVGTPSEDFGSMLDVGLVHLFLGSSTGLKTSGSQMWSQASTAVPDDVEASDRFGSALTFGDFDNFPGADLAVGSPGEKVGTFTTAGAIFILSGRATGLTGQGSVMWTQETIDNSAAAGNGFGVTMAAGDFDGDGNDDLAVGAPFEDVSAADQGTVTLMRGTVSGLRPNFAIFSQIITGNPAAAGERFGLALASADFGGLGEPDGYDDLVIGAPGAGSGAGRVDIVFSDWAGLGLAIRSVTQTGAGNSPEAGDGFGGALAVGRVGGSPTAWLAIGVPNEDIGSVVDAGAVHMAAPRNWLTTSPTVPAPITEDSPNIPDENETADRFGSVMRILDVDKDGNPDLVVGVPNEQIGAAKTAGRAFVIKQAQSATPSGVLITQGTAGVPDSPQAGDRFGFAVGG